MMQEGWDQDGEVNIIAGDLQRKASGLLLSSLRSSGGKGTQPHEVARKFRQQPLRAAIAIYSEEGSRGKCRRTPNRDVDADRLKF